ncbi:hypothetical protein SCHPADRAFT_944478 [Schizopora paradoxa]|uniref:BTB domain-containing protein n=1 Tax=Schizopora paradoxa TaxID=27342 RepID=A0A0H2R966_9AGAM|nr:hypothetical protein SCHPADRAFT_944478 [Schizopora paradoxa]
MDVDTQLEGPPRVPKPHDFLWFPDGNVVLATDTYLFKVHKSLLAVHSSVFRDMFELPNVGHADPMPGQGGAGLALETYEGVPMVTMVGDKGEDVAHLLRAVFEPNYYHRDDDNTPLEVIVALLLLSTKYDFNAVRKNIILHLSRQYPMNLEEYSALDSDTTSMFGKLRNDCHFTLLAAALTADVDVLLPGLLLACSDFSTDYIFRQTESMTRDALRILIGGRDSLDVDVNQYIASLPQKLQQFGSACPNGRSCFSTAYFNDLQGAIPMQFKAFTGAEMVEKHLSSVCEECCSYMVKVIDGERKELWEELPSYFELPGWAILQANLKAIIES